MELTLKNSQLITLANILIRVQPKSMPANRGRAKIFSKVQIKLQEYVKDEAEILETYCELDEAGQLLKRDGSFVPKASESAETVNGFLTELGNEPVILKAGEYAKRYMDFLDWLAEAADDFTAEEVVLIDDLLEQYETSNIKKGDKIHD